MTGWNGTGQFVRVYSWVADKNAGIPITASRMDTDTDNITGNGFDNCLTRDGQGAASANLPMNGFRHTGVGNASARNQYGVVGQIQDNSYLFAIAAGTADALTATFAPALTAFVDGMQVCVRAVSANTTATPTFAPNGLAAHTITKNGNQPLVAGDIAAAYEVILRYVAAGTHWEILNPATGQGLPGINWIASGGTANAITATYVPAVAGLTDGLIVGFRATAANTTTTPTFSPNGLTAHTITRGGGTALNVGDIPANLAECLVRYNLANTRWELLNPATPLGGAAGGVTGDARNAAMTVTVAGATQTFTADEVIVSTVLGGQSFRLSSYSQACNLGATGPGGMDTGAAPASGFVSLYAIYNPSTNTSSILACAVGTSSGTIYGGANMPAGYTASALLSTWPTTAGSVFATGYQRSRHLRAAGATSTFSITSGGAGQVIDISAGVPINAKMVDVQFQGFTGGSLSMSFQGGYVGAKNPGTATDIAAVVVNAIDLLTAQQIVISELAAAGAAQIGISGYWI